MIGLLIITTIASVAYPMYVIRILKDIPETLSATYSTFQEMYQTAIILMGLGVLPIWVNSSHWYTIPFVLTSCVGMVMAAYVQEWKRHCCIVVACCLSAILWQICEGQWIGLIVFGILFLVMSILKGKPYLWAELATIYSVIFNMWI